MQVRIYQQPKTAMQSGRARTNKWVLEFEPHDRRELEPLMGWTASRDTRGQVRLWFDDKDEAVSYAQRNGYMYTVEQPHSRKIKPKAYADNFRVDRLGNWTH